MSERQTVIGEINVEVKAGLSVDEKTARICSDLLSIYFKNRGYSGIVLQFDDYGAGFVKFTGLETNEEVDMAMNVPRAYKNRKKEE